ncbi:MAG: DOPA 4,5-dioxygenase family protein [Candidatus Cloacimonetes bacterium]|nr:DOPA 4,5-dioxygenase family protein [Candidatus Cloacimonadota bacterium]
MTLPYSESSNYHAHIYFDQDSLSVVEELVQKVEKLFDVQIGRVHQKLVGPHPKWSCQFAFNSNQADFVKWLDQNREGLSVLVHGCSTNDLLDHTKHLNWLGEPIELNLSIFH